MWWVRRPAGPAAAGAGTLSSGVGLTAAEGEPVVTAEVAAEVQLGELALQAEIAVLWETAAVPGRWQATAAAGLQTDSHAHIHCSVWQPSARRQPRDNMIGGPRDLNSRCSRHCLVHS